MFAGDCVSALINRLGSGSAEIVDVKLGTGSESDQFFCGPFELY